MKKYSRRDFLLSSAYLSAPLISMWKEKGKLDHNNSKVVSGISDIALKPVYAAKETARILTEMFNKSHQHTRTIDVPGDLKTA